MSKRLLIDGDQFLFNATAAVEQETRWDEQNHVLYSNELEAWKLFTDMVERIKTRFPEHTNVILFFSDYPVWRTKLDQTYKAGRSRKPLCYQLLRDKIDTYYTVVAPPGMGLEADDVMGILATKPNAPESIVVSQDKDMGTVPCTVWNGEHLLTHTEQEADHFHLYQTLTGDVTDGYRGCPGMGPVSAKKLLDGPYAPRLWWEKVVAAYAKKELTEADALVQARLARILRWSDWNADEKVPILWTPKTAS